MQNLPSLPYPEYIDLFKEIAHHYHVADEDLAKLLDQIQFESSIDYSQNGPTTFTLSIENEYPIKWIEKKGKIFEIKGPNMRNKTNTLIYTATLLGLDWSTVEPYIDDKKLIRQADYVKLQLSNEIKARLRVENNAFALEIVIENSLASISLWSKKANDNIFIVEGLSLESESDWEEYRDKLSGLFDIQIVAKGRNFIAQVGFEEASNLAGFCKETCSTIAHYMKFLNSEAPKRAPETIKMQIEQINERIKTLYNQRESISTDIVTTQAALKHFSTKATELETLLNKPELKNIAELKSKVSQAKKLRSTIMELENDILTREKTLKDTEDSIEQNNKLFTKLGESVKELEEQFLLIKDDLNMPKDLLTQMEQSLKSKAIDKLIMVLPSFKVDHGTAKAHKALGNYNPSGVSLESKLLGVQVFSYEIETLNDLRKNMTRIGETAQVLLSLSSQIDKLENLFKQLSIKEAGDYQKIKNYLLELTEYVQSEKQQIKMLKDRAAEEKGHLQKITRGYESIAAIEANIEKASTEAVQEDLIKLEELIIGVEGNHEDVLSKLNSDAENMQILLQSLKEKETSIFRQIQQLKQIDLIQKNNEFKNAIAKETFLIRIESLANVQTVLANIDEFFTNKRSAYERRNLDAGSEDYEKLAKMNEHNLGEWFDKVIDLINERIKARCPFAFINMDGVQKATVKSFDFLQEDFEVEGLPDGAKRHGGITSGMTVYGLATKKSGSTFGSVLLVDEWGDVGIYKDYIFEALSEIPQLSFSIFVDVDENAKSTNFEVRW